MKEIKYRGIVEGSMWHASPESDRWQQFWVLADKETIGQYTGLKDKNGKEIYEGDIVKHPNWRSEYKCEKCGYSPEKSQLFKIIWQKEWNHDYGTTYLGRWSKQTIDEWDTYEFTGPKKYEIIGNIHENPELLESKTAKS